jgi:hypothetical protein
MVSVKEAVAKAIEFAQSVLDPARLSGLRLEEVDTTRVDGDDIWLITLSMLIPQAPTEQILGATEFLTSRRREAPRDYKVFTVNSRTGQILSMKIRELANAE